MEDTFFSPSVPLSPSEVSCPTCNTRNHVTDTVTIKCRVCDRCRTLIDVEDGSSRGKMREKFRSDTPIEVGAIGTIQGKRVKVVGMVKMRGDGEWEDITVVDPEGQFYGLSHEEGHYTFGQEVDGIPDLTLQSHVGQSVPYEGKKFKVTGKSSFRPVAAIGELDYCPNRRAGYQEVEALCAPEAISVAAPADDLDEADYERSEYVPAKQVGRGFKLHIHKPSWRHILQPVWDSKTERLAFYLTLILGLGTLLFTLGYGCVSGTKTLYSGEFTAQDYYEKGPVLTDKFEVKSAPTVCRIAIQAPSLNNSSLWVKTRIVRDVSDKQGTQINEVMAFEKEMGYYFGGVGEDAWTEGGKSESELFRIDKNGTYRLIIEGLSDPTKTVPASQWESYEGPRKNEKLKVKIEGNIFLMRYGLIYGFIVIIYPTFIYFRNRKRRKKAEKDYSDSDYDDDDDYDY